MQETIRELNLPPVELKRKRQNGKEYVYDPLRRQYVRLSPEEFVRQHFVSFLIHHRQYPAGLLANEVQIKIGNVFKRCDTVLYDSCLQPVMIIEYKAPSVRINQQTFDQIARYNGCLRVPWLIVSNGMQHFCCRMDLEKEMFSFVKSIPFYENLEPV